MNALHISVHVAQAAVLEARWSEASEKTVIAAQLRLAEARRQTTEERFWRLLWEATAKLEAALDPGNRKARAAFVREASDLLETLHDRVHIGDPD